MKSRTCMELGVCQSRPGCPICQQPQRKPQVPVVIDGPFASVRTQWLRMFRRRSMQAVLLVAGLSWVGGYIYQGWL